MRECRTEKRANGGKSRHESSETGIEPTVLEVPNEPGKSYQAFRVVRYLDPSRRRG